MASQEAAKGDSSPGAGESRCVAIAIDGSDYAKYAFQCKYSKHIFSMSLVSCCSCNVKSNFEVSRTKSNP